MSYKLHDETVALVKEERRLTGLVIANLQKISDERLYLDMGYSSLFEYCTKALGYAEASAYRRIQAVKIARVLPEVREKLDSGALNLTNLAMAQSLITSGSLSQDEKREVITRIENKSKKETEKILVDVALRCGVIPPPTKPKDKVRHISPTEVDLHVRLSLATLEKLERLKSLRAHKNPNMSHAELIDDMCEFMLKKVDLELKLVEKKPVVPAKPKNPRYIPSKLRVHIWQRDGGRCTFTANQRRCDSHHLLQIDHIRPLAHGGATTAENLRLLCHAHHRDRERMSQAHTGH